MTMKLYTVDDVAKMTGLTSRTIHNYIKDGKLEGKKIGVQWRFTEENIQALFKDKKVEDDVTVFKNNIILEYLENKNHKKTEVCSVIDYPSKDKTEIDILSKRLLEFINSHQDRGINNFSYQYIEEHKVARFIVIGAIHQVNEFLAILQGREHGE